MIKKWLVFLGGCFLVAGTLWAANPLMTLEGTFSDSSKGVLQGSKQVSVKLTSNADLVNASEGTILWQETLPSVFFVDGFMAVELGQTTLLKKDYFLQPNLSFIVAIDGVTGKVSIPIRNVPLAFYSQVAGEALKVSANNIVGSITADKLSGSFTGITSVGTLTSTLNVSSGLVVNSSLIYANAGKNMVGIGTTRPSYLLDVAGSVRFSGSGALLVFPDGSTMNTAVKPLNSDQLIVQKGNVYFEADSDKNSVGDVRFKTAGVDRLIVLNNGWVGVGNTDPTQEFDVNGGVRLRNTSTLNPGTIFFDGTNFKGYDGTSLKLLDVQSNSGGGWTYQSVSKTIILTDGQTTKVSVGTLSQPSALEVYGTVSSNVVRGQFIGDGSQLTNLNLNSFANIGLTTNKGGTGVTSFRSNGLVYTSSTGNRLLAYPTMNAGMLLIGTGVGAPTFNKLIAGSGASINSTAGSITIAHAFTSTQTSATGNNGVVIQSVSLDRFGHVTRLSTANLDTRYDSRYYGQSLADTRYLNVTGDVMTGPITFSGVTVNLQTLSNNQSMALMPHGSGKVGIGTSIPLQKLDINGGLRLGNTTANIAGSLRFDTGSSRFQGYNGTDWVYLDLQLSGSGGWGTSSGKVILDDINNKVGIGSSNPTEKLTVGGNIFTTGNMRVSGNALITGLVKVGSNLTALGKLATLNVVTLTTDVTGTLPITNGGTGATTTASVRTAFGVAKNGANSDITSLTGLTTALSVAQGGTGSTTASGARTALGLGIIATKNAIDITGGDITGTLPVAKGGTGGTTFTSGTFIRGAGTSALSSSAILFESSSKIGIGTSTPGQVLDVVGTVNVTKAFTVNGVSMGSTAGGWTLGSGKITLATDTNKVGIGNSNPTEKLTVAGNIFTTGNMRVSGNALITGLVKVGSNLTALGKLATLNVVTLTTDVTGALPVSNGGTGVTTTASMRTAFGVAKSGANSDITSLTGLATALSVAQGGTGSTTAAGARSSLGLGIIATKNAIDITGGDITGTLPVSKGGTGGTTFTSGTFIRGAGTSALASSAILFESSSKIGIGTSTPGQVLDVVGTVNVTKAFTVNGVSIGAGSGASWAGATKLYTMAKVGIGITSPNPAFHVVTQNGVVFTGAYGTGTIPVDSTSTSELTGAGNEYTRLMWYPKRAAFRVGLLTNTNKTFWDDSNIGNYSIAMGSDSRATADYSVVAGGSGNLAGGQRSFVGSGVTNFTYASDSAIVGGNNNKIYGGSTSFIGGGSSNQISQSASISFIGGGQGNSITKSLQAAILGGRGNVILNDADYSTIGGGYSNRIDGASYSFAAGRGAKAVDSGSFVWGDSTSANVQTTAANQFIVRASGGLWFGNNSSVDSTGWATRLLQTSTGAFLTTSGTWTNVSDKNRKENFQAIDLNSVLEKIDQLPVTKWNYKVDGASIKHIGPVAQDFYAAFQLGDTDTAISTIDESGVALAAIKALSTKLKEKDQKISDLEKRIEALEKLLK